MKFNCKKKLSPQERNSHLLKWHLKFTWLPVRVADNDCRWLEFVLRRYKWIGEMFGTPIDVEYKVLRKGLDHFK